MTEAEKKKGLLVRVAARLLALLVALGVLGGGGYAAYWLMTHKPRARRRKAKEEAALVRVMRAVNRKERVVVAGMGKVVAARQVDVAADVAGRVVTVGEALLPGGLVKAGEVMVRLERKDYELALKGREVDLKRGEAEVKARQVEVALREAETDKAKSNLEVEMGRRRAAEKEYRLFGEKVEREDERLILREPQVDAARAGVKAAEVGVDAARAACEVAKVGVEAAKVAVDVALWNLERTVVRAPFDGVVRARYAEVGARVAPGQRIATLVATDAFWLEVAVPKDQLRRLKIPGYNADDGSVVRIYDEAAWGRGAFRRGVVRRLLAWAEEKGQMAVLIVAVDDPLDLKRPVGERRPVLLGSMARVEMEGREVEGVVRLPWRALREGEYVWVMKDGRLKVKEADVVWSGREWVLVRGIENGEAVVVSDLAAPVEGMKLRVAEDGK